MPLEYDAEYTCPYCGEQNFVGIDPSAGAKLRFVEDCPVCCSPIVFTARIDRDGQAIVDSAEAES